MPQMQWIILSSSIAIFWAIKAFNSTIFSQNILGRFFNGSHTLMTKHIHQRWAGWQGAWPCDRHTVLKLLTATIYYQLANKEFESGLT